jgi:hypothetical protein
MRHYLLEKSRVTKRGDDELNFHIFYQLYAGLRSEGKLDDYSLVRPSAHTYLQGQGAPSDGEVGVKLANAIPHHGPCSLRILLLTRPVSPPHHRSLEATTATSGRSPCKACR